MEPSIRLTDVSVNFGKTKALENVSLEVSAGKIIGLLGPSGAGKTTLMRIIIGHQRLRQGTAVVLGQPAGAARLRSQIGYMPQGTALYTDLTVYENIKYFGTMHGVDKRAIQESIAEVDLADQAHQLVSTLSGGQKSRASLAVALLGAPDLLVLDEPTVGVDPVLRQKLWSLFRTFANRGVTLVVSSHVMDEAEHCDDLVLVRRGRILAHGSPSELLQQTHTQTIEDSFLSLVGAHE